MSESQATSKELQKLERLVARGKNGEHKIAGCIQQYLVANPELYEVVGNVSSEVKEQIITHIAQDQYSRVALTHHVEALKAKLCGDSLLDPLESLLVDEVVISYMLLRASDLVMIRHQNHLTATDTK